MMLKNWVESVVNISEGRDKAIIDRIGKGFSSADGVLLLHTDSGLSANRTVYTIAGPLPQIVESIYNGVMAALQHINLNNYSGNHPYIGAVDVIPIIPLDAELDNMRLQKEIDRLADQLGKAFQLPIFYYAQSARFAHRKSLSQIRKGGIKELAKRMQDKRWIPDNGINKLHPTAGATALGIRQFMLAYNISLKTNDIHIAQNIARHIRTSGGTVRRPDGSLSKIEAGSFKNVKAIGWFVQEYNRSQVSINVYDLNAAPLKDLYDAIGSLARKYGTDVYGSELIGLVPEAYLESAARGIGADLHQSLDRVIDYFGLSKEVPFQAEHRILEWVLKAKLSR